MRYTKLTINDCPVNVIELDAEPDECNMCGTVGFHRHAVPWYYAPVRAGCSEGGYKTVCSACHARWAAWNDLG